MTEAVVFLDEEDHDVEDGDDRRCLVGHSNGNDELSLSIYGPDQSATEFLNRTQWDRFVLEVNRVMGWGPRK